MTYPTSGGTPDPYQPQQPYGQPYDPTAPYSPDPAQPASGQPAYGQPTSGQPSPYGQQPPYGQPPPYGQSPYGQPGYGQPTYVPVVATTNTMAILALVFAFVFAPASIVLGHLAKKQIRQTGEQGEGLATAGLWLGYIFTGLLLLVCVGYIIVAVVAIGSAANAAGAY
jgi:hypothetical protein